MTDAERGIEEWRELHRLVEVSFEEPVIGGKARTEIDPRACLRLTEKPSFANYRQWMVWGPPSREQEATLRRLVWRADLDGPRGNPMWRLGHLDHALVPTIEAAEASAPLTDVEQWLARMPGPASVGVRKLRPLSISLDGATYSIELRAAAGLCRYDWRSVALDATPVDPSYQPLATWYEDFRDWLDSRFEG